MTKKLKQIEKDVRLFSKIELTLLSFCLCVGPILRVLNQTVRQEFSFLFFLLIAVAGFLVGLEFPLANKIYLERKFRHAAGTLYALDLGVPGLPVYLSL